MILFDVTEFFLFVIKTVAEKNPTPLSLKRL